VTNQGTVKIGSVGPRDTSPDAARRAAEGTAGPRAERFPGVEIDSVAGLDILTQDRGPGWHNGLRGAKEKYLDVVPRMAKERGWEGVTIGGAPVELMNPGIYQELKKRLSVPVTTAMLSCAAAMHAFGAQKALLMTGFFEGLDEMLYGYYCHEGIELVWPSKKPFADYDEGSRRTSPETLFEMLKSGLKEHKGVQAVYFQGAINSGPILQRVEEELGLPVVSSGQANNWYILSRLGKRYPTPGGMRLFSEWPALAQG
jgi:hypothetical protein